MQSRASLLGTIAVALKGVKRQAGASQCCLCWRMPAEIPDRKTCSKKLRICRACHLGRVLESLDQPPPPREELWAVSHFRPGVAV